MAALVLAVLAACAPPDGDPAGAAPDAGSDGPGLPGASGEGSSGIGPGAWTPVAPLPLPVANNAVASLPLPGGTRLFSFLGLDSTKTGTGITRRAFSYDAGSNAWREIRAAPGPTGRLAAAAAGLKGRVYLFGGYTVDAEGGEVSVPDLDIYDPSFDTYSKGRPFPLPVDDAVLGVWRDSLIFIVSGWSQRDNVPDVQIYDPAADEWQAATPIPGPPVFGHAGAIVGDAIIYCDGVRVDPERSPRFVMAEACYRRPGSSSSRAAPTTRTTTTGSATTAWLRRPRHRPSRTTSSGMPGSSWPIWRYLPWITGRSWAPATRSIS